MATRKKGKRNSTDFYPTPPWPTRGLFSVWQAPLGPEGYLIEPCAGDGAIVCVAREFGYQVQAFELRSSCGPSLWRAGASSVVVGCDWLKACQVQSRPLDRHALVTNPPFGLAFELAAASWGAGVRSMAFLLRLGFLASEARVDWLRANPPTQMVILANRPSFTQEYLRVLELQGVEYLVEKKGSGRVAFVKGSEGVMEEVPLGTDSYDYAWLIWERGASPRPPVWIRRQEYELEGEGLPERPLLERSPGSVLQLDDYR
jgi:hypothetical protein